VVIGVPDAYRGQSPKAFVKMKDGETLTADTLKTYLGERISKIHGHAKKDGHRLIVPMFHPAAALHQGALRGTIEEDFARLPKLLAEIERTRARQTDETKAPESPAAQIRMF